MFNKNSLRVLSLNTYHGCSSLIRTEIIYEKPKFISIFFKKNHLPYCGAITKFVCSLKKLNLVGHGLRRQVIFKILIPFTAAITNSYSQSNIPESKAFTKTIDITY